MRANPFIRTRMRMIAMTATAAALSFAQSASAVVATGGNATNDVNVYRIHIFTNSATASNFVVTAGGDIEVLVVAGGGGGGGTLGGGGGAGGLLYNSTYAVTAGTYSVVVGAGGLGGYAFNNAGQTGTMGSNSQFGASLIAFGGGGGAGWTGHPATGGGSGGGGNGANTTAGGGTNGQGWAGGSGYGSATYGSRSGGGGGGAGSIGTNGTSGVGGRGGVGLEYFGTFYAGGGGGGIDGTPLSANSGGLGGLGGGGAGSRGTTKATDADPNTGGGGGGAGYSVTGSGRIGGNGGSGIVIVRYILDPNLPSVENEAAVNLRLNSADMVGSLISTGTSPTTVHAFWATNDCTTNEAAWIANGGSANLGPRVQGETFTNTVNGLAGDTLFYFNFMASNTTSKSWGTTVGSPSFRTLTLPVVNNSTGATAVGQYSATLNGNLTTGMTAYVYIYWWTNNASVSNVIDFGDARSHGLFSTNLTGLAWGTLYNYQCFASNAAGTAWAVAASNFTTQTPSFRYVTPTGAGTFSGTDWANAHSNVQDAVTASAGQVSEIYLQSGMYTNTSQLVISNHPGLTLRGGYVGSGTPGDTGGVPTILARGTATTNRIVFGYSSAFTLHSLTVSNGWGLVTDGSIYARGGGLYLTNCTVTLTNCVLAKNRLPGGNSEEGGGIYAVDSTLNIQGGRLSDNGVVYHGDGNTRNCNGGAIRAVNSTSVFDNVVFERNLGGCYNFSYGQCLYITGGRLTARECQFTGNRSGGATAHTSGLFQFDSLQALSISSCVFTTNYHSGDGGLIYVTGTANGLEIVDSILDLNEEASGAAILYMNMSAGSFLLRNCVFSANKNSGIYKQNSGSLSVSNCLFYGQKYHGIRTAGGPVSIANCTLTENLLTGVTNSTATVTMKDTIVWNNIVGGVTGTVTATYCNSQNALAGAGNISEDPLFVPDYYLSASDLQGVNSPCVNAGSALASTLGLGSAPYTTRTDGGMDSGQVEIGYHYTNGIGGAAIYLTLYVDAVNGDNSNVGDNSGAPLKTITAALAKISAGGTIHVATGTYNTALGETLPLVLGKNNLSIKGTNRQNTIINGAGSNRLLEASTKGNVWIEGLTFTNGYNLAGSGLYLDTCLTTITNCMLTRNGMFTNTVSLQGGAIYASGGYLTVLNSELSGNGVPLHLDASQAQGGAIWANGTVVTLDGCTFRTNAVSGYGHGGGGCLYIVGGSAALRNCQFFDNRSRTYDTGLGVLYLSGQTSLSISNCHFSGNTMYGSLECGVVYVSGTASGVGMVGCTFTNNTIANAGGGIVYVVKSGGSMGIRDTIIGQNKGNGIWNASAGTLGVTNSLIHSQTNSGVLVTAGTVSLSSMTIANNGRWGVTNSAGTVTVKNSIVWGNTSGGIRNATVNYTDSQEVNAGTENLNTDPLFTDTALYDFSVKPGSPCVNKGDNEVWMETGLDLAGGKRMIAARVDMGAFESSGRRGSILSIR